LAVFSLIFDGAQNSYKEGLLTTVYAISDNDEIA